MKFIVNVGFNIIVHDLLALSVKEKSELKQIVVMEGGGCKGRICVRQFIDIDDLLINKGKMSEKELRISGSG
jgi:predicted glycosyltransferase